MGTIDRQLFEKWGARGCGNSDYNLVKTTCCGAYLVEDRELGDLYTNPENPSAVLGICDIAIAACPACGAAEWDYQQLAQWPRQQTAWLWAYHPDKKIVEVENRDNP